MTFSQAQLHAAEAFILKNRKNLEDKHYTIPREVWLVAAAMQEGAAVTDKQVQAARMVIANGIRPSVIHGKVMVAIPDSVVREALESARSSSSDPKRAP